MIVRPASFVLLVFCLTSCGAKSVSELETESSIDKAVVAGGDLEPGEECYACNHVGDPDEEQWRAAKNEMIEACIVYHTARCEFRDICGNTSSMGFCSPPAEYDVELKDDAQESGVPSYPSPEYFCRISGGTGVGPPGICDTRPIRWLKEFEGFFRCGADNLVCTYLGYENQGHLGYETDAGGDGRFYRVEAALSCFEENFTPELGFPSQGYGWMTSDFACPFVETAHNGPDH